MKSNAKNDGRSFEGAIARTADAYRASGVMWLEKCSPPARVFGRNVIFLKNPFPDYVGCLRSGRMVAIECKSTAKPRLGIGGSNGVREDQNAALGRWGAFKAVSGVLWEVKGSVVWLNWTVLDKAVREGRKSVEFKEGAPVPQGMGFVLHDFYGVWERTGLA